MTWPPAGFAGWCCTPPPTGAGFTSGWALRPATRCGSCRLASSHEPPGGGLLGAERDEAVRCKPVDPGAEARGEVDQRSHRSGAGRALTGPGAVKLTSEATAPAPGVL